jgi:hypothetical protein
MFVFLLAATSSTAGEPVQAPEVILSPEAAAEEAHEELMGELEAMSEDVRTIDIDLLMRAMRAHQEEQAALVSLETSEITDDSGDMILAPVPVFGPSVAP